MKKKAFKELLSSIDQARILKARERVIKAAKRQVKIWGPDNPLNNSLHNAVTALNNLESK